METATRMAKRGSSNRMISKLFRRKKQSVEAREPSIEAVEPLVFESNDNEPTLLSPVSQACTQAQMDEPPFFRWCQEIGEEARYHRKQWEFCYILQALYLNGMLAPEKSGLGFGVGAEPLVSLIAEYGASVLATDLAPRRARRAGWVESEQHAKNKAALNERNLCEDEAFEKLVSFRYVDMNVIPDDLSGQFDFCWSACAFEHLGSIRNGLEFVENSVKTLRPGGLAVHTTEFNCSYDDETLDRKSTVLFRRQDFIRLAERLRDQGYIIDFNFNLGDQPLDKYIDVAPYDPDTHLKLQLEKWVTTSFGLLIRKPQD